ncbi:PREDICTED: THAP domain-containing protein 4-like isoform X2 [Trachymyrmex septentrionalis]|uniref:THAP domain-containing protein 4-like isoform X2 n=1 Tax=Trachymyrmex septentrionalis TaxID=34720 RepID=UPI00084F5AE0|nr:PREDICTED: THAP domain-containing protein 4-like isoform X2 [Trachymyrmex septentrionalis]
MVTCAAVGCKNSSNKGVKMNCFPKNAYRRNVWIRNAKLENKILNRSAALCEFHFTSNMWEKIRIDGTKKLKCTAVPTIFGELVTQQKNKKAKINQNSTDLNGIKQSQIIISKTDYDGTVTISINNPKEGQCKSDNLLSDIEEEETVTQISKKTVEEKTAELYSDGNIIQDDTLILKQEPSLDKQNLLYMEKIKKLEKLLRKSESLRISMEKRHKRLQNQYKNRIKELEKKI